jgi:Kef-type K+ transport system membrane component KefB
MLINTRYGLEYFAGFDAFSQGLFGSFYLFFLLWLFSYLGSRGHSEKPTESALSTAIPVYVFAFFLNTIGVHSVIAGLLIIVAYVLVTKINTKMKPFKFAIFCSYFATVFGILSFVDPWIRNALLIFALGAAYLQGNKRISDKKDKKSTKE